MSSYNQNNLLIPLIIVLGNNGGSAKTSELIGILDSVLLPNGDDLVPYSGRRDSKFSQTVRNALAPERSPQLISEGYATVNGDEGENKYVLTKRGWEIYRNLLSVKIKEINTPTTRPYQQIFYGAPGTGKSKTIKDQTEQAEKDNHVFRTTFHPDSDYSTFVGCYKPTMKVVPKTTLIGTKVVEVENGTPEEKIVYRFTPQAFTNAYVKAWSTTEDVYLIIEEINRGNCAQIFGDLFQLLDRGDDGKSEYPIDADTDLGNYIAKELESSTRSDFPDGVKDGKKLVLPPNLFIWATMNTSDQSLFPIDSAFKRRWDWVYMPIENAEKGWKIKVNGNEYDWYQFLAAINKEVFALTHSEDKQLGYFFAKAKGTIIDAETLVNKVYFYLWTDVFKDYDFESQKAFRKPNSNEPIAFKNFFEDLEKGEKVNERVAEQVLVNLELEKLNKPQDLFE